MVVITTPSGLMVVEMSSITMETLVNTALPGQEMQGTLLLARAGTQAVNGKPFIQFVCELHTYEVTRTVTYSGSFNPNGTSD